MEEINIYVYVKKPDSPGINTYPDYTLVCCQCGSPHTVSAPRDQVDATVCPACGAPDMKLLYISYPSNGPGFQEGYTPEKILGGVAEGVCVSDETAE